MASSRWKRFAFFEKNALSLPSEVLEDLIPVGESSKGTTSGSRSSRRSVTSLSESSAEASNNRVNLVVTTAALPLDSKPSAAQLGSINNGNAGKNNDENAIALNGMWSSVTACNPMEGFPTAASGASNLRLHSQAQAFEDDRNVVSSGTAIDGIVLAFVTSRDTNRVHCFDISVRCNSKNKEGGNNKNDAATGTNAGKSGKKNGDLEDLDGWRGYLAPMKRFQQETSSGNDAGGTRSSEDRIISEHMGGSANNSGTSGMPKDGIVGIATCRASSGHKPIHMACITANDLVVCVDPHLYLSW